MDSLFQVWLWGSCKLGYIKKYNIQRDESMKIARESLEEAFTPRLRNMLANNTPAIIWRFHVFIVAKCNCKNTVQIVICNQNKKTPIA